MSGKRLYGFNDASWWDSPGCDCCEGYYMEAYNAIDEEILFTHGTCHSIEDCIIAVLHHEGHTEANYEMDIKELSSLLDKYNLGVMIDGKEYV